MLEQGEHRAVSYSSLAHRVQLRGCQLRLRRTLVRPLSMTIGADYVALLDFTLYHRDGFPMYRVKLEGFRHPVSVIEIHDIKRILHAAIRTRFRFRSTHDLTTFFISVRVSIKVQTLVPFIVTARQLLTAISTVRLSNTARANAEVEVAYRLDNFALRARLVIRVKFVHGGDASSAKTETVNVSGN